MGSVQAELSFSQVEATPWQPRESVPIDSGFPEHEANELSRLESYNKNLFRPNTYLHKWWARRSGTTFRFILKQLVRDVRARDYYAAGGLEGMTVLDPMMGGGTTLHEAIRLGANVIGYDLDPIPVLQLRASLTHVPLTHKATVFENFLRDLRCRLQPYFRTLCPTCREVGEVQFVLYGARKSCACGESLVVDSFILREEADGRHSSLEQFYPQLEVRRGKARWRIVEKTTPQCESCGSQLSSTVETAFPDRYVPLVVVGFCEAHGRFMKAVDDFDIECLRMAKKAASGLALPSEGALRVLGGPKSSDLLKKGIQQYSDLFTPRQLLYISTAKTLLDSMGPQHRLWLALLVSTSLEFNSVLCGYKGTAERRAGAIRHVFSHHAYSFPFTSLESNPVFSRRTSGTLTRLFEDRIEDAGRWAAAPVERELTAAGSRKVPIVGETDYGIECRSVDCFQGHTKRFVVQQRDSSQMPLPSASVDFVVTDPPYFDSVQYSDLSHFFRVWLQWFLPGEADWSFDHGTSAVAESEGEAEKYRAVLTAILAECNRVLRRPHGRLIFTFHHWRADAWVRLTLALRDAGFRLVSSYTVHSENPISVHIRQLNALRHDSILVFQPKELRTEIRETSAPGAISRDDSFGFCRGCAELLGYCLDNNLGDADTSSLWRSAWPSEGWLACRRPSGYTEASVARPIV